MTFDLRDLVSGTERGDFLVGGVGGDKLNGREGVYSMIGGAGADMFMFSGDTGDDLILDFVSGEEKIDLHAYEIDFSAIQSTTSGADTLLGVDTDGDDGDSFEITLVNVAAPVETDFLFA